MKLVSCLAVAFMLTAAPASAEDWPPSFSTGGNTLFTVCSEPHGSESLANCYGYVVGVADTLAMTRLACLPRGVAVSQLTDIVLNELRNHPENRHHSAASIVAVAFKRAFPCQ
jgi:Rap1a immunity proteins